jgi:hypothetical protein
VGSTRSKREFARASTTIALALDRPRSRRSRSSTRSSFTSQIASLRAPDAVVRATVRRARSRRVASPRTSSVTRFARASVGGRHSKTATRDFQRVWRGEVEPWCALDGGIVSLNA